MEKNVLGYCPDCGEAITKFYNDENGNTVYVCNACDGEFKSIVKPEYEVGDKVLWIDPCQEPNESDADYRERCNQVRTVSYVEYDGSDFIYLLDDSTEAYQSELMLAIV